MLDRSFKYIRYVCGLILLLSITSLGAQENAKPQRTRAPRPSAWIINEGRQLYLNYCAQCHGEKGDGNGPNAKILEISGKKPADHTDSKKMAKRTDLKLFQIVKIGGNEAAALSPLMPPWGRTLNDQEIWYLVTYMRSLAKPIEEKAETVEQPPQAEESKKEVAKTKVAKVSPKPPVEVKEGKEKVSEKNLRISKVEKQEIGKPKKSPKIAQAPIPKKQIQKSKRSAPTTTTRVTQQVEKEPKMEPEPRRDPKLIKPIADNFSKEADVSASRFRSLMKFDGKPVVGLPKGDPVRGRVYYAANCVTCHGPKGKGDGPTARAVSMDPKPRDHTEGKTMNKKTDKHLFDVVSQGGLANGLSAYMPAWGDVLTKEQIWDIVAYMRSIAKPRYKP